MQVVFKDNVTEKKFNRATFVSGDSCWGFENLKESYIVSISSNNVHYEVTFYNSSNEKMTTYNYAEKDFHKIFKEVKGDE